MTPLHVIGEQILSYDCGAVETSDDMGHKNIYSIKILCRLD